MPITKRMTPEEIEEYLYNISFRKLVEDINAKWSHTYEEPCYDLSEYSEELEDSQ